MLNFCLHHKESVHLLYICTSEVWSTSCSSLCTVCYTLGTHPLFIYSLALHNSKLCSNSVHLLLQSWLSFCIVTCVQFFVHHVCMFQFSVWPRNSKIAVPVTYIAMMSRKRHSVSFSSWWFFLKLQAWQQYSSKLSESFASISRRPQAWTVKP
jgi:hypothetical protein